MPVNVWLCSMVWGLGMFGNVWECRSMFGYVPWFGVLECLGIFGNVGQCFFVVFNYVDIRAEG